MSSQKFSKVENKGDASNSVSISISEVESICVTRRVKLVI